ncbi:class I adenylate-forming enzyme family protein [Nakamurella sp. GG22]
MSSPEQDTQPINVADLLRSAARRYPDRPAVISTTGTHTWAQLDAAADAGVAALRGLGVSAGERVVIALPTGADLAASLFATARAGVIAVPIGPSRGDVGAFADRVGAIAAISGDDDHGLPISIGPDRLAQWWTAEPATGRPATGGAEDLALLARVREDRAVMLSHRAILAAVHAIGELGSLRLSDGERVLQVLPMYHLAGWVVAFLPLTLVGGASVLPDIGFDARTVGVGGGAMLDGAGSSAGRRATESALQAAHDHRVTVIPGAPGFFHHLVKVPGAERSLSSVRLLTSGTAPLEPDDFTQVKSLLGQPVWEGYGLSESASVVTSSLATSKPHLGSVGRPLPGIELRLITPEGTDAVPTVGPPTADEAAVRDSFDVAEAPDAGEVGRIAIRGDTLFSGYWPDGGGGPGADGWFVTGDIGYLDDAGELHLVDRAAETVTVAGFTVYPREVEDVLAGHPYVSEVAVIGLPGGDGHQRVVAVLVARPGTRPTQDDLSEYVSERLPPFKRPGAYHLVEVLPRTEVGRLDRASVQRRYAATVGVPDRSAQPARLASVPAGGDEIADARAAFDAPVETEEPDVAPEEAAGLDELGTRLPGTGDRVERGDQDTDEDLF